MPRRGATTIGNTPGGRGPLPAGMTTMSQYYRSGRASALNPRGTVRDQNGARQSGKS